MRFEQQVTDGGLTDVTVDVGQLSLAGIPAGVHGFHIHQFGDSAVQCDENGENCATMVGGHFVPVCQMRRERRADDCEIGQTCELTCGSTASDRSCKCDEIHGLPPSGKRMVGDMGNLECDAQGACKICFDGETGASCRVSRPISQEKLSLYEEVNSIVGRALAVHEFRVSFW